MAFDPLLQIGIAIIAASQSLPAAPPIGAPSDDALPGTIALQSPSGSTAPVCDRPYKFAPHGVTARTPLPEKNVRISHAKELLGKRYRRSVVKIGEKVDQLDQLVHELTEQRLKGKWKKQAMRITQAILDQARRYEFDPIFLLAVIENESSFNPTVRGSAGEIGLMQLLPDTARWVARQVNLRWKGKRSLYDPVVNIQLGAAYLALLREQFESKSAAYVSAYNRGAGSTERALNRGQLSREYWNRVMKRYLRFYRQLEARLASKS